MKFCLFIFSFIFSVSIFGQEICFNGIDDDGDGFIDLNDEECFCNSELIQNSTLQGPCEFYADFWASAYGPNYTNFSACGTTNLGIDMTTYPPPLPATAIVQLTSSNFAVSGNMYQCLSTPLIAGETYTFTYDYAITSGILVEQNPPPTSQIWLYGIPSCPNDYLDNPINCPNGSDIGDMTFINNNVFPAVFDTWNTHTFNFTPSQNLEGIMIAGPCYVNTGVYMLTQLTNISISNINTYSPEAPFFSGGSICTQLIATADLLNLNIINPTIQWFLNGIAISGATSTNFLLPPGSTGVLNYAITNPGICGVSDPLEIPGVMEVSGIQTDNVCFGGSNGAIETMVTNGVPEFNYLWSNGETSANINNLESGQYSITVTGTDGCQASQTFVISSPPPLSGNIIEIIEVNPLSGFGSATVEGIDGSPPYTYLWDNGETNATAEMLSKGEHTVIISDTYGCIFELVVEIPLLPLGVNQTIEKTCFGQCTGFANIDIEGGLSPYEITWNNGNLNGFSPSDLCVGNYNYTVTDATGQEISGFIEIIEYYPNLLLSSITAPTCDNPNSGSIVLFLQGYEPYSFEWQNGNTLPNIFNLSSGNYFVTITDVNECEIDTFFNIQEISDFEIISTVEPISCNDDNNGSINISVVEPQNGIYTYNWSTQDNSSSISGLGPGLYNVTITDENTQCQTIESFELLNPQFPVFNLSFDSIQCGITSVSVTLESEVDLEIIWDNDIQESPITISASGIYEFSLIDPNNCSFDSSFTIVIPDTIAYSFSKNPPTCNENNGSITITELQGTAPFEYEWNTGGSSDTLKNISEGSYTVTITDANGCIKKDSFFLENTILTDYTTTGVFEICPDSNNGEIEILSNDIDLLEFNWNNGSIDTKINNLSPGVYSLSITDSNGCTTIDSFEIKQFDKKPTTILVMDESCYNSSDGSIEIINNDDFESVQWVDGDTSFFKENLLAGEYFVTLMDNNACFTDTMITINEGKQLKWEIDNPEWTCDSDSIIIKIQVLNTDNYTILWNNVAGQDSLIAYSPGEVNIKFIDNNTDCSRDTVIYINSLSPIVFEELITDAICMNNNGSIQILSTQNDSLNFEWSNGSTSPNISNLSAGNYQLTITDQNNCSTTYTYDINYEAPLIYEITTDSVSCFGENSGAIYIQPNEFIESVFLDNNPTSTIIQNLGAGNYFIEITDTLGCTSSESISIFQPLNPLIIIVDSISNFVENMDGYISISAFGGIGPYSYIWNNGENGNTIENLDSGNYQVTVTDSKGCEISLELILPPIQVTPLLVVNPPSCFGDCNGSITFELDENLIQYDLLIISDSLGNTYNNRELCPGIYDILLIDQNGNDFTFEDIYVDNPVEFSINIIPNADSLYVEKDVPIEFDIILNPNQTIDIYWLLNQDTICKSETMSDLCFSISQSFLTNGKLQVIARSNQNCMVTDEIHIFLREKNNIYIPNIILPNRNNENSTWKIFHTLDILEMETSIYDRWGNQVYYSTDLDPKWDGTFKNKELVPGVYSYLISYKTSTNTAINYQYGDITVIR